MTLDEQKKLLFVNWLEDHDAIDFKCAACGRDDFAVLDEVVYLSGATSSYPNVGIICTNCKYTLLFNVSKMDLLK